MARSPRRKRPRVDCWLTWLRKINGHHIMPRVTRQEIDDFCRANAAVETFEARARIVYALRNLPFPTLSVRHLIDQLRDAEAKATTLAQEKQVGDSEFAFSLLETNGVTTKEDYDAALPIDGQHTKNVLGLKHYKIQGYTVYYVKDSPFLKHHKGPKGLAYPIKELADNGPIYAWFQPYKSFQTSTYKIYKNPTKPAPGDVLMRPHALCLFAMGSRGRTAVFGHQNNWGTGAHIKGRGFLHSKVLVVVIVPKVEMNWD